MNETKQCDYDCIFFIDETGDESRNDTQTPFFGLGGIKVDTKTYKEICKDWMKCKDIIGYTNKPFHACDFGQTNPTNQAIQAINEFVEAAFFRFAVYVHKETRRNGESLEHNTRGHKEKIYDWLMRCVLNNAFSRCSKILIVCESSSRDDDLKNSFFKRQKESGSQCSLEVVFKKKDNMIAGLEIADLVCHTATRGYRANLKGEKTPKDFEKMFPNEGNRKECSLIEILYDSYSPPEP